MDTLKTSFEFSFKHNANSRAVVADQVELSYSRLQDLAGQLALHLRSVGISGGDRVGILVPTSWQFVVTLSALVFEEAVFLPLDPDIGTDTFNYVLENCGVKALVADIHILKRLPCDRLEERLTLVTCDVRNAPGDGACDLERIVTRLDPYGPGPASCDPNDLVSISFTSGSTGRPKGVMHSSQSWLCGAQGTAQYFGITRGDSILIGLPLAHTYALRHLLAYLLSGATLILARDFLSAIQMLESQRPSALLVVPSAINILLRVFAAKLEQAASHLRFISIGTAAISDEQLEQLRLLAPAVELHLPYGLTEARVGFLELNSPRTLKYLCQGIHVTLRDGRSRASQDDGSGEIYISGPGLMLGYWGQTEEEKDDLRQHGFASGDMGRLETDGRITLLGRLDDMVNVGGEKVAPSEVEAALAKYPKVLESAVFGIDDPAGLMGQELVAVVVVEPGSEVSQDLLRHYLMDHLEPHKVPKRILFDTGLPKSSAGKTMTAQLKSLVLQTIADKQ